MRFDVILPTIGRESLPDSINSVLRQSMAELTLMVVFDMKLVDEAYIKRMRASFNDNRIQWCKLHPGELVNNWSGTDARNLAIDSGVSPWIAYVDDDDVWMPYHLQTFTEMSKNHYDMLHTRGAMVQYKRVHPRKKDKERRRVSYHDDPTTVSMAHTRLLFEKTRGWQPIENHDHALWADMIKAGGRPLTDSTITYEFLR